MELAPQPFWQREELSLFMLRESDVSEEYVAWLNNPKTNRFLESRFVQHSVHTTRAFVRAALESTDTLMLGMRSPSAGGQHVGNIKLGPIDTRHGLGEVGLLIGAPTAWGRGFGRTSISVLCDIAARQLGLRKLTAGCYASNIGSQKAFAAAGFTLEGRREKHFMLDDRPEDLVLMAKWLR